MEENIQNIISTYNEAITMCQYDSHDYITSTNPTLCGIEQIMEQPIAHRLRGQQYDREPMHKTMCGCRLTARLIFTMIILGVYEPTPSVIKTYDELFSMKQSNIVNTIMGKGLKNKQISDINKGLFQNIYSNLPLTKPNLFIVQILKYVEEFKIYTPVHSFVVILYEDNMCEVLSSWFSDEYATPIIYNKLSLEELQYILTPQGLLNDHFTNFLFANNLDGILETIFISMEAITDEQRLIGGSKKNKNKKRKNNLKK